MFILQYWKQGIFVAVVALIAALSILVFSLRADVIALESEIKIKDMQLAINKDSIGQLQASIDDQNSAISKLKADSERRELEGRKLIEKAKADAQVYKRKAEDLIKLQPPVGKSQCESANELFNQEIRSAK